MASPLKNRIIPNEASRRGVSSGPRRNAKKITIFGIQIFLLVFSLLFLPALPAGGQGLAFGENVRFAGYVRVAIIEDAKYLSLKISGPYEITDSSRNYILSRGKNLKTTVTSYRDGILIGGENFNTDKITIFINDPDVTIINGRTFRGNAQFIKNKNNRLLVINHIDLEDYIKGILYHEASHYWPEEALKVQAVVCRTYAVYQAQEHRGKDYDVTSDIYSQVYGGRTSERARKNKVVEETRGRLLTYKGRVFPAYFHATCAGHTEDAALLWNTDIAPLKGVVCNFCKESPHFSWHYVLSFLEIKDKLIKAGYKISDIKDIVILGRNNSGRITGLKIIATNKDFEISAKDFRNIIGPNIIRSTNFNLNIVEHDAVFEGLGWGHGVGLCQWGAYFMAKQGFNASQILKYYYPGSELSLINH